MILYDLKKEMSDYKGSCRLVSNSKNNPKNPPPDDFSKTTPNLKIPIDDETPEDWDASEDVDSLDTPADDWGKTVINYNVSTDHAEPEVSDDTQYNSDQNAKEANWGMTQPNINVGDDFGSDSDDFEDESADGVTVPYFRLPEAEQKKYQNIPLTPTEKAKKDEEKKKKKGGIPTWFWVSAGLMGMFTFALVVLLAVWFFFMGERTFTVVVKGAKPGSIFLVDGDGPYGVSSTDKSGKRTWTIYNLSPTAKKITIRKKGYKDDVHPNVRGSRGEIVPIYAQQIKDVSEKAGCKKIVSVQSRENCANTILSNLDNPPNLDDLLRALNYYYINFDSGQHTIPKAREKFLERAATFIKQLPNTVIIEVGGHTDNVGSDDKNQGLSERRANSVRDFFVKNGVNPAMLQTKGYGESTPKDSNETERGRFENRRIAYKAIKR